ncbi:MAG: ABC transporter ATP-binding protein, partial [Clostridia bacterium]|nr:ABC transporter ATP-binding protein [Clostridia bacterium]
MKRTLEELQKQYNKGSSRAQTKKQMPGPGPRRGGGPMRATGKPKNTKATVKRLMGYIARYKVLLLLVFLMIVLSSVATLWGTYTLRPVINNLIDVSTPARERLQYLARVLLTLGGIYLIGVGSTYAQSKIMLTISQNTVEKLRNDLFSKLQTLPVRYFDANSTGEVMSRFTNDVDNVDTMINQTLTNTFSSIIQLVGVFVLMVSTNIWLTMITVAFVPIVTLVGGKIAKVSGKYYAAQQAALGAMNGYIEESVGGAKVVKVFN